METLNTNHTGTRGVISKSQKN